MDNLLKLRLSDPATLTDAELISAAHGIVADRERLYDKTPRILREVLDRFEITWPQISALTGYPMPTVFNLTR